MVEQLQFIERCRLLLLIKKAGIEKVTVVSIVLVVLEPVAYIGVEAFFNLKSEFVRLVLLKKVCCFF